MGARSICDAVVELFFPGHFRRAGWTQTRPLVPKLQVMLVHRLLMFTLRHLLMMQGPLPMHQQKLMHRALLPVHQLLLIVPGLSLLIQGPICLMGLPCLLVRAALLLL